MLIKKDYVLSNEMAKKGNIALANFSMFINDIEKRNIKDTVQKFGQATFINTKSEYLPNHFYKILYNNKFTNFENCAVLVYMCKEFQCSKEDLLISGIVKEIFEVQGKQFLRLKEDFISKIKNKTITNISYKDYIDCDFNDEIDGGVKLSKDNYLVWY